MLHAEHFVGCRLLQFLILLSSNSGKCWWIFGGFFKGNHQDVDFSQQRNGFEKLVHTNEGWNGLDSWKKMFVCFFQIWVASAEHAMRLSFLHIMGS